MRRPDPNYPSIIIGDDSDVFDPDADSSPPNPEDLTEHILQKDSAEDPYKGMSPFLGIASVNTQKLATIEDIAREADQPTHDIPRALQEYARAGGGGQLVRQRTPNKLTVFSPYLDLVQDPVMILAADPDRFRATITLFGTPAGTGGFRVHFATSSSVKRFFAPDQFTMGSDQNISGGQPRVLYYQDELWAVCDATALNGAWVQTVIERY